MERRVLLAIFLAFMVLYVWQAMFVKPVPKPVDKSAPPAAEATQPPGAANTPVATAEAAPPNVPSQRDAETVTGDKSERDIRIETRDVIAVFTNKGGRLKSW